MIKSTLAFIFSSDLEDVLLITKERPSSHKGLLNGLGGKNEGKENSRYCITREVQEEAAIYIEPKKWVHVGNLSDEQWQVKIFTTILTENFEPVLSPTSDLVSWYKVNNLPSNVISNLTWLIPLCVDLLSHQLNVKIKIKYQTNTKF